MQDPNTTSREALTAALRGLDVEKELERADPLSEINNFDLEAYFAAQEREKEAGEK